MTALFDGELIFHPCWLPMPSLHMKIEENNMT
jgi:hypothetical protein